MDNPTTTRLLMMNSQLQFGMMFMEVTWRMEHARLNKQRFQ